MRLTLITAAAVVFLIGGEPSVGQLDMMEVASVLNAVKDGMSDKPDSGSAGNGESSEISAPTLSAGNGAVGNFLRKLDKKKLTEASATFKKMETHSKAVLNYLKSEKAPARLKNMKALTSAMAVAGPVFMFVSTALSVVSMFASDKPVGEAEESEELKAIKEGFERMELGIQSLQYRMSDTEFLVSFKAVQTAIHTDSNAIKNLYTQAMKANPSEMDNERFKEDFKYHYKHAAKNLFHSMVANELPDLNLLDAYRDFVKCNTYKVQRLCLQMVSRITQGQVIEGHFYALQQDVEGLNYAQAQWEVDMKNLTDRCEKVVQECSDKWQYYANEIVSATFSQHTRASNEQLADKIYAALNDVVPQRVWAVWVHKSTSTKHTGHRFSQSPTPDIRITNRNSKDVVAMSFDEEQKPLPPKVASKAFDSIVAEEKENCKSKTSSTMFSAATTFHSQMYPNSNKIAEQVVNRMNVYLGLQLATETAIYAVERKREPAYRAPEDRVFHKMFDKDGCLLHSIGVTVFH